MTLEQMTQKWFWWGSFTWVFVLMWLGTAGCNAGRPTGRCFKANMYFFLPLFQVFLCFDIYSVFLCSGFNFGLLSSITESAKPEEICLVIAVFLLIVEDIFARAAFCRTLPFINLFVLKTRRLSTQLSLNQHKSSAQRKNTCASGWDLSSTDVCKQKS